LLIFYCCACDAADTKDGPGALVHIVLDTESKRAHDEFGWCELGPHRLYARELLFKSPRCSGGGKLHEYFAQPMDMKNAK
jgi:hypothetical protein